MNSRALIIVVTVTAFLVCAVYLYFTWTNPTNSYETGSHQTYFSERTDFSESQMELVREIFDERQKLRMEGKTE